MSATIEQLYRNAQAAKYGDDARLRDRYTLEEVRAMRRDTCRVNGTTEVAYVINALDAARKGLSSRSARVRTVSAAFVAWYEAEWNHLDPAHVYVSWVAYDADDRPIMAGGGVPPTIGRDDRFGWPYNTYETARVETVTHATYTASHAWEAAQLARIAAPSVR